MCSIQRSRKAATVMREGSAARDIGQQFIILNASGERDIDNAFAALLQERTGALIVSTDPFLFSRYHQIVVLAAYNGQHELPRDPAAIHSTIRATSCGHVNADLAGLIGLNEQFSGMNDRKRMWRMGQDASREASTTEDFPVSQGPKADQWKADR